MSTICAISTPPGVGGLAVVRVSGPQAIDITQKIWSGKALGKCTSHSAHLGWVLDSHGERLDQGVATLFRGPKSFTGEDVVELSLHGSVYVQQEVLNALISHGCRIAEPGEFTRRAFSSGRIDLTEAEAVADVISSTSRAAHRLAVSQMKGDFSKRINGLRESLLDLAALLELELDFSDQEVEFASRKKLMDIALEVKHTVGSLASTFHHGEGFKNGIPTAIVGATNVGKSTLLNRLLHDDRAIVSDIHGTTRDTIEDTAVIDGVMFRFIDTAGLRETTDTIEALGIERSINRLKRASIIVLVGDATHPHKLTDTWEIVSNGIVDGLSSASEYESIPPTLLLLWNKIDMLVASGKELDEMNVMEGCIREFCSQQSIPFVTGRYSAIHGTGDNLEELLLQCAGTDILSAGDVIVTNARHYEALRNASDSVARVINGLNDNIPPEFVAQDLRETLSALSEITGTISTPTILSAIFSRFCIGK